MELYIMRHGMTDWNKLHRLQGRTDISLNEEGRAMAIAARERYREMTFDICYCSPLKRAKETAELFLQGSGTPIIEDNRLCEMSFGCCEGTENYFEIQDHPITNLFQRPEEYVTVEGGEGFSELFERTGGFLEHEIYTKRDTALKILIVGHGAMNCSIVGQIRKIPLSQFWDVGIPQCELLQLI